MPTLFAFYSSFLGLKQSTKIAKKKHKRLKIERTKATMNDIQENRKKNKQTIRYVHIKKN